MFFKQEVEPIFEHLSKVEGLREPIKNYHNSIDDKVEVLYKHRKDYEGAQFSREELEKFKDQKNLKRKKSFDVISNILSKKFNLEVGMRIKDTNIHVFIGNKDKKGLSLVKERKKNS